MTVSIVVELQTPLISPPPTHPATLTDRSTHLRSRKYRVILVGNPDVVRVHEPVYRAREEQVGKSRVEMQRSEVVRVRFRVGRLEGERAQVPGYDQVGSLFISRGRT